MTTNNERRSATIIPFPARSQAINGGHRAEAKSAMRHGHQQYAMVASGGAWYHEAAMAEDARQSHDR